MEQPTEEVAKDAKSVSLFQGVHFCLCDDVSDLDEVKKILVDGGGKLVNYLSDVVTHLIAERDDHPDVIEALEIYEKPVVTTQWVRMSVQVGRILPVGAFNPSKNQLFSSVTACLSNLSREDAENIWALVTYYGGRCRIQMNKSCSHLITPKPEGSKYDKFKDKVKVVTPDWIIDSVKNKRLCDEDLYQPRLLVTYCTRPVVPTAVEISRMQVPTTCQNTQLGPRSQSPGSAAPRKIFSQSPVRVVQFPKTVVRMQAGQPMQQTTQFIEQPPWAQQHPHNYPQHGQRPMQMESHFRPQPGMQQVQMQPRNQTVMTMQQQNQPRTQQLNFIHVRQVQSQQQQYQQQPQTSQKPPNVILQQRIQPPVHTLSLQQQAQQNQQVQQMNIHGNPPPQHMNQQTMHLQRHPDMNQQMCRQNFAPRAGFVNQPRVPRVPQMRMQGNQMQMRGNVTRLPQQMMVHSFDPDMQRMTLRPQMDMIGMNQNQMARQVTPSGQGLRQQHLQWNEMPPQMRGQLIHPMNIAQPTNQSMVTWQMQPNQIPPGQIQSSPRDKMSTSPRSGDGLKRNSGPSASKSGVLSSVSPSVTCAMSACSPCANSALVTSKTKTALANLLNTRLQNSVPGSRTCHEPLTSCPGSNCTSSSSSSTSTPTSLTAPASLQSGDGSLLVCCPLSPSTRLACVGSPGVILPTGEVIHRGLLETTPVQERYFGHDPNSSIPNDLCLVGCTFFLTGYDGKSFNLGLKQRNALMTRIKKVGGQVEETYSPKVTHVICDFQDAPFVEQAIREQKRCVSIYWLELILREGKLKPPTQALHLPKSRRFLPVSEIISSTGFSNEERKVIREITLQMGAVYTPHFCSKNTVLVCKKPDSEKFNKALEWSIPVVNVQWLNDMMLGVNDAGRKPYGTNQKHKRFDLNNPIDIVDFFTIQEIMMGWKNPIHVPEKVLVSAIENRAIETPASQISNGDGNAKDHLDMDDVFTKPPAKKPRLGENLNPDIGQKTSEKMMEESLPPPPPLTLAPNANIPFRIMITGVDKAEVEILEAAVKRLGAKCTTKFSECTHLVIEKPVRTVKFLSAFNHAKYVVSKSWITQSDMTNSFVSESLHRIPELGEAIEARLTRGKFLLDQKVIYVTAGCIPSPPILQTLIESAGGIAVTTKGPTKTQMAKLTQAGIEFLIISNAETDLHLVESYLEQGVICLHTEWLMTSLMTQKLADYGKFKLEI